jgi:uncharacterized membrane protein
MHHDRSDGVPSTAAIKNHPIHPMLIPFPIAFLVAVLLVDLAFAATGDPFWARAALWLLLAGLISGAAAAVAGLIDFSTIPQARIQIGWIHFLGNALALALSLVSLLIRIGDPAAAVLPWGLILSIVVAGILGVTGWLGGELVYRHRIAVVPEHEHRSEVRDRDPAASVHRPVR